MTSWVILCGMRLCLFHLKIGKCTRISSPNSCTKFEPKQMWYKCARGRLLVSHSLPKMVAVYPEMGMTFRFRSRSVLIRVSSNSGGRYGAYPSVYMPRFSTNRAQGAEILRGAQITQDAQDAQEIQGSTDAGETVACPCLLPWFLGDQRHGRGIMVCETAKYGGCAICKPTSKLGELKREVP